MPTRSLTVDPHVVEYAANLLVMTRSARDDAPRAANGRPIALSDRYAEQVIKDMCQGRSMEWQRIMATLVALSRAGHIDAVMTILSYAAIACKSEAAIAKPTIDRPIAALIRHEERSNGPLNLMQLDLRENSDPRTLKAAALACRRQITATRALFRGVMARLVGCSAPSTVADRAPQALETTTATDLGRLPSGVDQSRCGDCRSHRREVYGRSQVRSNGATPVIGRIRMSPSSTTSPTGGAA